VCRGARHPRGRQNWPFVGILAQRAKDRPNRIGTTVCHLDGVGPLWIEVTGLDAIDNTPCWMSSRTCSGSPPGVRSGSQRGRPS
jgi:hypothetical protein